MKTVTEFAAITIKNAAKTQQELQAAGKTAEEMPQALGEALKVEGDKLTWLTTAIELAGNKPDDLKRVLVLSIAEGEKPPLKSVQKGEHYFQVEYYASLNPPKQDRAPGKDFKGGKGKGGKGGDRGKRGGRGGRREGQPGERRDQAQAGTGEVGQDRRPRPNRPPRGPRPEGAQATGERPALPKPRNPVPAKTEAAPAAENTSPENKA